MSRRPDPELTSLFAGDPDLERTAGLLRATRLAPPQLDPGFRLALRRRLMAEAYERYDHAQRPGLLSRLFTPGPRFALATAAIAAVLIGVIYFQSSPLGTGRPATRVYTNTQLVALDQPITVSFSRPMDHQSVQQAIHIEPATQVTYQWQGNNLLIQPVTGQLAANTQYHITVSAQAATANHAPIGQTASISVVTTGPPSPKPSPTPTPTPEPRATITGERSLPASSGTVVAWSADGTVIYFLAEGGDLTSIHADGQGLKVLANGVTHAWISNERIAYQLRDGRLVVAVSPGLPPQVIAGTAVTAAVWKESKLLVLSGARVGPLGGDPILTIPDPVDAAAFSPDATRLVYRSGTRTVLVDLATLKSVTWPTGDAQKLTWSPDSSLITYVSGDAAVVAMPDGTAPRTLAKGPAATVDVGWAGPKQVLVGSPVGLQTIHPDGSAPVTLGSNSYLAPLGGPAGDRIAFSRSGSIWVADLKVAAPAVASLDQGFAVVTAFETARISSDSTAAARYLTASAARTAPTPGSGDAHLKRFFLVSSQQVVDDGTAQRFLVRLVLADAHDIEIRYIDEQLTVLAGAAGSELRIDSVADGLPRPLGKGPTINAVQISPAGVVVVFDSDLSPDSVAAAFKVTGPEGTPLLATATYLKRQVTVVAPLVPGHRYRLTVSADLRDIAGQPLAGGAYEYDFVAPTISG